MDIELEKFDVEDDILKCAFSTTLDFNNTYNNMKLVTRNLW